MVRTLTGHAAHIDTFERLLKLHIKRFPTGDERTIRRAFEDALDMYGTDMHWTGETVLMHCLGVLEALLPFDPDDEGVIACMLHHAFEDNRRTPGDIEARYGATVRSLVGGVHLLSYVTMKNRRTSVENLRLMFVRVSEDIRAVLIILCDHHHKLTRLNALKPDERRQLCGDVLRLFAPVAARLGIYSLKHRMEDKAFPVAYPVDAARIAEQLEHVHGKTGYFLQETSRLLAGALREEKVAARVEVREKTPYAIFLKMRNKSITHVNDIYDLFALRVITETEADCYRALGVLHRIGHPMAGRFKDYIGFPKPNGYRSLHTTLARLPGVPDDMFIEAQIRTEEMHREANFGMAAHWSYKEGGDSGHALRRTQLQQALTENKLADDDEREAGIDHIFALTPQGDIIELPEGSTPLDFAFGVHSMLGLTFKAARVNGHIVPLSHKIENGDIVEILRHKEPKPSANWLMLLKTASAKARLKRHFTEHDRPSHVLAGRERMNEELEAQGLPPLDPDLSALRSFGGRKLTKAQREEVLVGLGQGAQTASSVLEHLDAVDVGRKKRAGAAQRSLDVPMHAKPEGNIPMPVRFALCCAPDEGPRGPLTGVIGRDGTVRVHRLDCAMTRHANPERIMGVKWEKAKSGK